MTTKDEVIARRHRDGATIGSGFVDIGGRGRLGPVAPGVDMSGDVSGTGTVARTGRCVLVALMAAAIGVACGCGGGVGELRGPAASTTQAAPDVTRTGELGPPVEGASDEEPGP